MMVMMMIIVIMVIKMMVIMMMDMMMIFTMAAKKYTGKRPQTVWGVESVTDTSNSSYGTETYDLELRLKHYHNFSSRTLYT